MLHSPVDRSEDTEAYRAWREVARQLIVGFHKHAFQPEEAKQVESAIIELVAEYLWLDLGERAAWDVLDVAHWRQTVLLGEPSYRSRVRATLINFYEHLTSIGLVSVADCARIQEALEEHLADSASSASARSSYMRLAVQGEPEAGPVERRAVR